MTTNTIGESGLQMVDFISEILEAFSELFSVEGNIYSPVDIAGDTDNAWLKEVLDVALANDNVGMALALACPTVVLDHDQLATDTVEL